MTYPQPRVVRLSWADAMSLTVLETARACVAAQISDREAGPLMRATIAGRSTPDETERAARLYYAIAWQLERRLDPSVSWDDAQTWRVELDATATDDVAEAEARASVSAAIETGLPPAVAGELTTVQLGAYREIRAEHAKAAKAARGSYRRHR